MRFLWLVDAQSRQTGRQAGMRAYVLHACVCVCVHECMSVYVYIRCRCEAVSEGRMHGAGRKGCDAALHGDVGRGGERGSQKYRLVFMGEKKKSYHGHAADGV